MADGVRRACLALGLALCVAAPILPDRPAAAATRPTIKAPIGTIATLYRQRTWILVSAHGKRRWQSFSNRGAHGAPVALRVFAIREPMLQVGLPGRPNGARGWVSRRHVRITHTPYRLDIDLSRRLFFFGRRGRMLFAGAVVIGTRGTPTPVGQFSAAYIMRSTDRFFGPYALALNAYSGTLRSFAGGPGQTSVHGTSAPRLLGGRASHGCVRVSNRAINEIIRRLPLGGPVDIHG